MKWNKSMLRSLINSLFAFLLTLLSVTLILCAGFSVGLFSNKSIIKAINQSNYYNNVYQELSSHMEDVVTAAGLPSSVLTDVITLERVYIGGKNYVDSALRGEEAVIKTDKLQEQLMNNINLYVQNEDIIQSEDLNSGITKVISVVEAEYKDAIQLQFVNDIVEYRLQYHHLIRILVPIVIVLIGILCYFLLRMQKYIHKGVRYIVYALMASSLMTMIVSFYLVITKPYAGMNVLPDYYKKFISAYLHWDLMIFIYIGGIGLTISIALISLISYLKNGIKNN